jgi:hypothetical protein
MHRTRLDVRFAALLCCMCPLWTSAQTKPAADVDSRVRMNQIQVIGTHNSYHAGLAPSEGKLLQMQNPKAFAGLEYRHQPLDQQLAAGVRQIELDVFADSQGGRYAHDSWARVVAAAHLPADPDFDPQGVMQKPGFKVMHVQDVDYRSTCQPFTACLKIVRQWSQAHPNHVPIYILVETKQQDLQPEYHATTTEKFTSATFDALDADVRGGAATLEEAVLKNGWPTLKSSRGKVVFLMDQHPAGPVYLEGHPSLKGRVLFTNAMPGEPDCAFIEKNDGPATEIADLVRKGYLVRTRTDADTQEARTGATTRRDDALASGAQLLSTDYPVSEPASFASNPAGFVVGLPGGAIARCNPINAPASCSSSILEKAETR